MRKIIGLLCIGMLGASLLYSSKSNFKKKKERISLGEYLIQQKQPLTELKTLDDIFTQFTPTVKKNCEKGGLVSIEYETELDSAITSFLRLYTFFPCQISTSREFNSLPKYRILPHTVSFDSSNYKIVKKEKQYMLLEKK